MSAAGGKGQKFANIHEENARRIVQAGNGRYLFNLAKAEGFDIGPHYSSARGAPVRGQKIQVVLVTKVRGSGATLHTHANEQFNFVVQGRMSFHVDGVEGVAGPGEVLYIPANAQHWTRATDDGDLVFYASKDTSDDISGDPVDETKTGPYYAPGFEPKGK